MSTALSKSRARKLHIFGAKPEGSIFLPEQPYGVRLNCQAGQIAVSETEFLGTEMEISIIACNRYYGDLGKTRNAEWLQIFFIPAPNNKLLPPDTVCVTYIKTRSLTQFTQLVTKLMAEGEPAEGIFRVSFMSHMNKDGQPYKSVRFDWRPRYGEEEVRQLEQISDFLQNLPEPLQDLNGTRDMIPYSEYKKRALELVTL